MQAEFFGLPGLADKASAGLDTDTHPAHDDGEAAAPSLPAPASCQYDSVYLETGFHPVKSEYNVLQQQQAATMEVSSEHIHSFLPTFCSHVLYGFATSKVQTRTLSASLWLTSHEFDVDGKHASAQI